MSTVWNNADFAACVLVAEDLIRRQMQDRGKDVIDPGGKAARAFGGIFAEPTDQFKEVVESIPKIITDAPNDMDAARDLIKKLGTREGTITRRMSFAPGMEYHHFTPNNAIYDALKYADVEGVLMGQQALERQGVTRGVADDAGGVISAYGHRVGPMSAHRVPGTSRVLPKFWGMQPIEMPLEAALLDKEEYMDELVRQFDIQKAKPSEALAREVMYRERPLIDHLVDKLGRPLTGEGSKSAAVTKKELTKLISSNEVNAIAESLNLIGPNMKLGSPVKVQTKDPLMDIPSRPGVGRLYPKVLRM